MRRRTFRITAVAAALFGASALGTVPAGAGAGPSSSTSVSASGWFQQNCATGGFTAVAPQSGGGGFIGVWNSPAGTDPSWSLDTSRGGFGYGRDLSTSPRLILTDCKDIHSVYRNGNRLFYARKVPGTSNLWNEDVPVSSGSDPGQVVAGAPAFVAAAFPMSTEFDAVAPLSGGGFGRWSRDVAADATSAWTFDGVAGGGEVYTAVGMIQSSFGWGTLEVLGTTSTGKLHAWSYAPLFCSGPIGHLTCSGNAWSDLGYVTADGSVVTGVSGPAALIQSRFGSVGNYELAAPLAGGGIGHWWRDNNAAGNPWHYLDTTDQGWFFCGFGGSCTWFVNQYTDVSLIQASNGLLYVLGIKGSAAYGWVRDKAGWGTGWTADPSSGAAFSGLR